MIIKQYVTWHEIGAKCKLLALKINNSEIQIDKVIGIARGGIIPGSILARILDTTFETISAKSYNDETNKRGDLTIEKYKVSGDNILFVDDICDSGHTLSAINDLYKDKKIYTATLFHKENKNHKPTFSTELISDEIWITFPWED